MEDAAVEEAVLSGAAELAPALVAVARPPPARRLDESCPPREFTSEEEARSMASSSSSSVKASMPESPPEEPAPAPTQAAKKEKKTKKVKMPRSRLESLMDIENREPLCFLYEEWLKGLASHIPNGEQFLADPGFSLETMVAEIQEQLQEKGYVEIEVSDEEEEEEEEEEEVRIMPIGRRRFRPGICKKPDGSITRLR